jgi:hypothetical protein
MRTLGHLLMLGCLVVSLSAFQGRKPAPTVVDGVRITAVSPTSVVAGDAFTVAIVLPKNYPGPVVLGIYRDGFNIQQHKSVPLNDDDENDGARGDVGLIRYRVKTTAQWTSALARRNRTGVVDRYRIMIEQPLAFQLGQTLTVVGTALTAGVDSDLLNGFLKNLESAITSTEETTESIKKLGDHAVTRVDSCGTTATYEVKRVGTIILCDADETRSGSEKAVYVRSEGLLWTVPRYAYAKNADAEAFFTPGSTSMRVRVIGQLQQKAIADEATALKELTASLGPEGAAPFRSELLKLQVRAAALGIKFE